MNILDAKRDARAGGQMPAGLEDVGWVPLSCSILAHRVEGVITKIEGNPESVVGKGRLCAKVKVSKAKVRKAGGTA